MQLNVPSLRASLVLTVFAMGFITIALAIYTGQTYQTITLNNQKQTIIDRIERYTEEALEKLDDNLKNLGLSLQNEEYFRKIFLKRQDKELLRELNAHFHQYFVTAGIIDLEKIYVYDINLNLITQSTEISENNFSDSICPGIIKKAKTRTGPAKSVTLKELCKHNGRAFFSTLVPIGSLAPKGYLQIIANPVHDLKKLDQKLATPIRISSANSEVIHQSNNWPDASQLKHVLPAHYKLHTDNHQYVFTISTATNLTQLNKELDETKKFLIITALLITFSTMILSFVALKKSTLNPIKNILKQLSDIHDDKNKLGQKVQVSGAIELKELAIGFNEIASELQLVYQEISNNNQLLEDEVKERLSAENALLRAQEGLEDKIKARTLELEKVSDQAQKANNAKSEFLSRMSHELRTPLNAILGYAELLLASKEEPLSSNQEYKVRVTQRAGIHLLSLINEVLDLSSIESGKISIATEKVNLENVVNETLTLIAPIAEKNNISIITDLDDINNVVIETEHQRLKQILLNLMTNAITYNKENGTVTLKINRIQGDKLKISIIDTGIGIADDQLDKLFLPFNRLDEYKSRVDGTGIGLTITKSLIELMNGEIGVESSAGEGSTFWVILPYSSKSKLDSVAPVDENITQETENKGHSHTKVLVVEDDEVNQELITSLLKYLNFDSDIAENGSIALDKLEHNNYSIILMDINMPVLNGIETTKKIRQLTSDKKNIAIIALTANAMRGDKEECLNAGMNDYLSKPVSIKTLKKTIQKWLEC